MALGLNLDKAFAQSENAGLGKGSVKRVFNDTNVLISDVVRLSGSHGVS